jgi:hypothetical protein
MALSFPHPTILFWIGLLVSLLAASGTVWVFVYEIQFKTKTRHLTGVLSLITVILPISVLVVALVQSDIALQAASAPKSQFWSLSPREKIDLKTYLCPAAKLAEPVMVGAIMDPISGGYAHQILEILDGCGIEIFNIWTPDDKEAPPGYYWSRPERTGIFVEVLDIKNPDSKSVILMDALHKSGIEAQYDKLTGDYKPPASIVVVGPRPL